MQGGPPVLGFFVACLAVTTAWMLDWRHYARYWLGRMPDYEAAPAVALRVFFALSWFATLLGVNHALAARQWTLQGLAEQASWALAMMAATLGVDGVFRWFWGRPPPS